jgi:hypothetical protein
MNSIVKLYALQDVAGCYFNFCLAPNAENALKLYVDDISSVLKNLKNGNDLEVKQFEVLKTTLLDSKVVEVVSVDMIHEHDVVVSNSVICDLKEVLEIE